MDDVIEDGKVRLVVKMKSNCRKVLVERGTNEQQEELNKTEQFCEDNLKF